MTTSKYPASESAVLNACSIEFESAKSRLTEWIFGNGGTRATSRDVPQTSSPRALRDLAMARPIPELAPVKKTFFINERDRSFQVEVKIHLSDLHELFSHGWMAGPP